MCRQSFVDIAYRADRNLAQVTGQDIRALIDMVRLTRHHLSRVLENADDVAAGRTDIGDSAARYLEETG